MAMRKDKSGRRVKMCRSDSDRLDRCRKMLKVGGWKMRKGDVMRFALKEFEDILKKSVMRKK